MKIGSAITFLLLALIALGYLLSDNINTREELVQIRQQDQQLSQELLTTQAERDAANETLAVSEQKVVELTQQNLAQQEQIQRLSDENVTLKEKNSVLQSQSETLKFLDSFRSSFPRSLSLAFLLPIIPVSMAATYVMVHSKKQKDHRKNQTGQHANRTLLAQLTEEEMKHLIKMRRGR